MLPLLVLAAVTPLFVPATPSPSPAGTLPEIGRVRSNALCTTLRQNIAPTLLGLMKNDDIIGAGHRAFEKMARDQAGTSSAAIDIDKLYLEQVETRIVHNLEVIDKILADERRFPASPKNGDERDANAMKSRLLAVAESQRRALDLVSGTLETESLGQMQHDISSQMLNATGQAQPLPAATGDPASFIGVAGLPEHAPASGLPTTSSKTSTLAGHSVYDSLVAALEITQSTTARREQVATSSIISAADECRTGVSPRVTSPPTATAPPTATP